MKGNKKYIILLIATIVLFVVIQLLSPKQIDWTPTFSARDKNPFGSFVLNDQLDSFFPDQYVNHNNLTVFEFEDSLLTPVNLLIMAEEISLPKEDVDVLLSLVEEGSHALLAADFFSGKLADTLGIFLENVMSARPTSILEDSSYIFHSATERERYPFKVGDMFSSFDKLDSIPANVYIAARNEYRQPTLIRIPWGDGELILSTTPRAFTNNYILYHNDGLVENALSYLPEDRSLWWSEYYQLGRMESNSFLRVILRDPSLSWAYYVSFAAILIFVFFESKRKQQIIPIIKPLSNATLEFVRTIGNMYFQAGSHKSIAEKKIMYFFEHVRSQYYLPHETSDQYVEVLAKKTGNTLSDTQSLMALIRVIQNASSISVDMLLDLNRKLDAFREYPGRVNHKEIAT